MDAKMAAYLERALEITGSFESSGDPWRAVAGDFDGMGVSAGILQWNLGSGTLQPLVRAAGRETVLAHMPEYGAEFWRACSASRETGLRIARGWQSGRTLRRTVAAEIGALFGSEALRPIQVAAAAERGEKAWRLAEAWARELRGSGRPSPREYCWFFDLLVQNGSLKGLWLGAVHEFMVEEAGRGAVERICGWLGSTGTSVAGWRDCHRNARVWVEEVDEESLPLFVLGYLRARLSRTQYRGVVMNRRGTVATGYGWVNGAERRLSFQGETSAKL